MEQSENKLSCPQCQGPMNPGENLCQPCREIAESDDREFSEESTEEPVSEKQNDFDEREKKSEAPNSAQIEPTIDLEKIENGVPWNAVILGMMVLFLLLTFFNK